MIGLQIGRAFDRVAEQATEMLKDAAEPALMRYVTENAKRAQGEWYDHCTKRSGFSGKLRIRVYRTGKGTLRAKVGSDAKYARYLMLIFPANKRVIDETLTDPMRKNIAADFKAELVKGLK